MSNKINKYYASNTSYPQFNKKKKVYLSHLPLLISNGFKL